MVWEEKTPVATATTALLFLSSLSRLHIFSSYTMGWRPLLHAFAANAAPAGLFFNQFHIQEHFLAMLCGF